MNKNIKKLFPIILLAVTLMTAYVILVQLLNQQNEKTNILCSMQPNATKTCHSQTSPYEEQPCCPLSNPCHQLIEWHGCIIITEW